MLLAPTLPTTDMLVFAVIFPFAVILPLTNKLVNVPTLVMFDCAAVVNVPAKKFAVAKLPRLALPDTTLPPTVN